MIESEIPNQESPAARPQVEPAAGTSPEGGTPYAVASRPSAAATMVDELSDELYDQAIAIVSEMKQVSISMLQRKMRIGYNRAARMIERMERDGVVGPADGAKPRDVLARPQSEIAAPM